MKMRKLLFLLGYFLLVTNIILISTWPATAKTNGGKNEISTVTFDFEKVASDEFYDTIPPATVECIFGGELTRIFPGRHKFKSTDNAILIDEENGKMAVREKIVTDNDKVKGSVDMFIQVDNVTQGDLVNLLVLKKTTRSNNAKVDLLLKKQSDEGEVTLMTGFNQNGENPNPAVLFAKVNTVKSKEFEGVDYYLVSGVMKIRLTEGLQGQKDDELDTSNTIDRTSVMKCIYKDCPVVKTNLERLNSAFGINLGDEDVLNRSTK